MVLHDYDEDLVLLVRVYQSSEWLEHLQALSSQSLICEKGVGYLHLCEWMDGVGECYEPANSRRRWRRWLVRQKLELLFYSPFREVNLRIDWTRNYNKVGTTELACAWLVEWGVWSSLEADYKHYLYKDKIMIRTFKLYINKSWNQYVQY